MLKFAANRYKMDNELFTRLLNGKAAYFYFRRRRRIIEKNGRLHAFTKGTVVRVQFQRSTFIGSKNNAHNRRKIQMYQVRGANPVNGLLMDQTVITGDLKPVKKRLKMRRKKSSLLK